MADERHSSSTRTDTVLLGVHTVKYKNDTRRFRRSKRPLPSSLKCSRKWPCLSSSKTRPLSMSRGKLRVLIPMSGPGTYRETSAAWSNVLTSSVCNRQRKPWHLLERLGERSGSVSGSVVSLIAFSLTLDLSLISPSCYHCHFGSCPHHAADNSLGFTDNFTGFGTRTVLWFTSQQRTLILALTAIPLTSPPCHIFAHRSKVFAVTLLLAARRRNSFFVRSCLCMNPARISAPILSGCVGPWPEVSVIHMKSSDYGAPRLDVTLNGERLRTAAYISSRPSTYASLLCIALL